MNNPANLLLALAVLWIAAAIFMGTLWLRLRRLQASLANLPGSAAASVYAGRETVRTLKTIAEKMTAVEEIALQINRLALTAAQEAARCGGAVPGLAAIADDIRKLADRSQNAAHEITELASASLKTAHLAADSSQQISNAAQTLAPSK